MSDTPDFDKMTPEEMMKWMESLAKRQGVDASQLTTSADMDVAEVSADDERAQGLGEYVPFGWKAEDWKKHLEKEEAEKLRKAAAAPQPTPAVASAPVPASVAASAPPAVAQPAAAAAPAAGDTPDFDKMSPEEIMKWMESLAVRQGATEGFTTSADMQVAEVSADDERAQGLTEYVPFEWRNKPEEWHKKVAAEEEEKKRKAAAAPPAAVAKPAPVQPAATLQPPAPTFNPPPVQQPAASVQPADTLDDFFSSGGLPILETDDEDETVAASGNPMDWLSGLTSDTDDSIDALAGTDLPDPFAELEALASGKEPDPDMDWLSGLADSDKSLDTDALANLAGIAGDDDPLSILGDLAVSSEQTITPASVGPGEGVDLMNWLETLAKNQGADEAELSTEANAPIPGAIPIPTDGPGYTPYSFESGADLSLDEPVATQGFEWSDDEADISAMESESPEDWLDQLAAGVGGDEDDVIDEAAPVDDLFSMSADEAAVNDLFPAADDDEDAGDTNIDPLEVMNRINKAENVSPEEIGNMFNALFEQAEQYKDRDEEFAIPDDDDPGAAMKAEIPDWLAEQIIQSAPSPQPIPEVPIEAVLEQGIDAPVEFEGIPAAEDSAIPDWLSGDAQSAELEAASLGVEFVDADPSAEAAVDMPDWLTEMSGGTVETEAQIDEVPPAEQGDLPDWLKDEQPDSDIKSDIFAQPTAPAAPAQPPVTTASAVTPGDNTGDTWVDAFNQETEHADDLARWYAEQTGAAPAAVIPEAAPPAPAQVPVKTQTAAQPAVASSAAAVLQTVELPVEADLPAGEPEAVPDWLIGDVEPAFAAEMDDAEAMPDWLNPPTTEAIPDWLQGSVDDSVTAGSGDIPDWLDGTDVGEEDIPGWLMDTMQSDEQPAISVTDAFTFEAEPAPVDAVVTPPPAPVKPAAPPVKASPAPVPAVAAAINVAAALQSARARVSGADIDGALLEYESIVRANAGLDDVVNDLTRLVEDKGYKKNPAIFRVLGDGLMRRGNLQQALDTYRKALNLL